MSEHNEATEYLKKAKEASFIQYRQCLWCVSMSEGSKGSFLHPIPSVHVMCVSMSEESKGSFLHPIPSVPVVCQYV